MHAILTLAEEPMIENDNNNIDKRREKNHCHDCHKQIKETC